MERARRVLGNTMLLTAVRVLVPLMSLAVVLALSRLLGAEGLGRYTLVFTVLYLANTVAPLGLYGLLTREGARSRERLSELLGSALLLGVCATIPVTVAMAAAGDWLGYDAPTIDALRLLSLAVLPCTVIVLAEAACVAIERVRHVAVCALVDNAIKIAGGVAALLAGYGVEGVILATVVAKAVAAVWLLALLRREDCRVALPERGMIRSLATAAPTFLAIQIFATIYWRIDVLMLSKLGTVRDVGLYGAAYRIFELIVIVPQSLCLALYPQIVQAARSRANELQAVGGATLRYLVAALLPAAVAATVAGGRILEFLYGGEFTAAVTTLAVLVWAVIPYTWVRYHAYVLVAIDQQRVDLLLNVVMSALNVVLNVILIGRYGHLGAAIATLISIVCYSGCQFLYLRTRHPSLVAPAPGAGAAIAAGSVMALVLFATRDLPVLLALAAGVAAYLGVLVRSGFFADLDLRLLPLGPFQGIAERVMRRIGTGTVSVEPRT
jgi:O-antigen/teichoic acid export membrane protein